MIKSRFERDLYIHKYIIIIMGKDRGQPAWLSNQDKNILINKSDIIIIATPHKAYKNLKIKNFKKTFLRFYSQ